MPFESSFLQWAIETVIRSFEVIERLIENPFDGLFIATFASTSEWSSTVAVDILAMSHVAGRSWGLSWCGMALVNGVSQR